MFDALYKTFRVVAELASAVATIVGLKKSLLPRQEHDREEKLSEAPMASGLKLLLDAHAHGEQLEKDRWYFAIEIGTLRSAGLTNVDFRWLESKGYVEHAEAFAVPGMDGRGFHKVGTGSFTDATCFILTPSGIVHAKDLLKAGSARGAAAL